MSSKQRDLVRVVGVSAERHGRWQELYQAYGEFYQAPITPEALRETWRWLLDPAHPQEGFLALGPEDDVVGLAHFRAFPEPMLGRDGGFLDDLFVEPSQRGLGIGRALIDAVSEIGRQREWPLIRWITASDNAAAQMLYDQVAERTRWITYDIRLGSATAIQNQGDEA
jgi:GNAT superfamily N-acetyltransferase